MQPRAPQVAPKEARNGARVIANKVAPQGVYLPNYNVLTPYMRSPEYVQMSTAAAITLGITTGTMYRCECTRCLNLLLTYPEGCRANCAYCGLARHREAERDYADRNFIRVDWPAVPLEKTIDIVVRDGAASPFHRMCISMITHPRSDDDTVSVLKRWTQRIDPATIPVSILSNPTTMTREDVARLRDLGADIFTVALDAATPEIFDRTRGKGVQSPHSWAKYWQILMDARDQWRRVQLARYLIDYRNVRAEQMTFDGEGRVTDYGVPAKDLDEVIDAGVAFRTSGCPGKFAEDISACDRPYGDSPPSNIASYPFPPNRGDVRKIRRQLRIVERKD
jgi:biotin synthase